jgi:hypothetical protein
MVLTLSKPPRKLATTLWPQPVAKSVQGVKFSDGIEVVCSTNQCNFDTDAGKPPLNAPSKSDKIDGEFAR